jgi:methylase of polypeptide subunit release factors
MSLARYNLKNSGESIDSKKGTINFVKADVLVDNSVTQRKGSAPPLIALLTSNAWPASWDILISNPPYISPSAYWKTTTRAVRGFEPKLALVPPGTSRSNDTQQGDLFYPRLLQIADEVAAKVVLLEVADLEQALRVARHARGMDIFEGIEIWRDEPSASSEPPTTEDDFSVHGEGNARSVVCWRGAGGAWLGKTTATTS